jgi:hypothetical protein
VRDSGDLREYLDAVDLVYFWGALEEAGVQIRWMRARGGDPTRVGLYWPDTRTIEIARHLADEAVPLFYVLHVVHHEACHALFGVDHEAAMFRLHERQFLHTYEAAEWERQIYEGRRTWPAAPKGLR